MTNAKLPSNFGLRHSTLDVTLPNGFAQLGTESLPSLAALGHHVAGVIDRRSEEQVVGPNAGSVIAAVEYELSGRDWSVREFPGYAVRCNGDSSANGELAVASAAEAASPLPAAIAAPNELPEPISERLGFRSRLDSIMETNSLAAMSHWKFFRT